MMLGETVRFLSLYGPKVAHKPTSTAHGRLMTPKNLIEDTSPAYQIRVLSITRQLSPREWTRLTQWARSTEVGDSMTTSKQMVDIRETTYPFLPLKYNCRAGRRNTQMQASWKQLWVHTSAKSHMRWQTCVSTQVNKSHRSSLSSITW